MNLFSSESVSLINTMRSSSWQTLQSELSDVLRLLQQKLENQPWWRNGWVFKESPDGELLEVYISKTAWAVDDNNYKVWIGVGGFTPENLFSDCPGQSEMYIWASKNTYKADAQKIAAQLFVGDRHTYGQIDLNVKGQYLVRYQIPKYSADDVSLLPAKMQKDIFDFMDYFGKVL